MLKQIKDLKIPESYFQIDTVKGFKYIDRAGEIMNFLHTNSIPPKQWTMAIDGLIINNPKENIEQIKITPLVVWAKIIKEEKLETRMKIFLKYASEIIQILDVKEVKRIGWRNYFVLETSNQVIKSSLETKFDTLLGTTTAITKEKTYDSGINLRLRIEKVINNKTQKEAVLFDADYFITENISTEIVKENFSKILTAIEDTDSGIVGIVNTFLGSAND